MNCVPLLLCSILVSTNTACPSWTVCSDGQSTECDCQCAPAPSGVVYCIIDKSGNPRVGVEIGFCITMSKANRSLILGSCPYNMLIRKYEYIFSYQEIPPDPNDIDAVLCGPCKRTGQLCGQCQEGYSLPVYSYYPQCVKCEPGTNNWPKYLTVSLLPTTVFFVFITFFRIRVTHPVFYGFILSSQILTAPQNMRRICQLIFRNNYEKTLVGYGVMLYFGFYSIWNLDFMRLLYTPFCLHPNATTLQVLSLDYLTAVFPLLLIILTYTLVRLHYNNCRVIVWLWRPFIPCFACCRRQWDIQNSLIDAFASFILLSYFKFMSVSFDILMPSFVWDEYGNLERLTLYYDGTVEYMSGDHIPYALLAYFVLFFFTLLPVLFFCIYPCRCFHRLLNHFNYDIPSIHKFMDVFQGYYKDGTNGEKDRRYFSAFFLILRIITNLVYAISFMIVNNTFLIASIVIYSIVLSTLQPYKNPFYLKLDLFFLLLIVIAVASDWNFNSHPSQLDMIANRITLLSIASLPLLYIVCLLLHYICKRFFWGRLVAEKFRSYFTRRHVNEEEEPILSYA